MKKYTHYSFYALLFIMIGIIGSCKNKNFTDHVGPSICASDNFQYVAQPSIDSVSTNGVHHPVTTKYLGAGPVNFSAKFNEEVPWTIVVTGVTTKSYKKFSGYGSVIDVTWVGNPDTLVFFGVEQCNVEFHVACKDPVVKQFNIGSVSKFTNFNYLIYDGDGGGHYNLTAGYGTYATHTTTPGLNSPQGGNCFCTHGDSSPTPVWYFGGYDMPVTLGTSVSSDPSKVYLNFFVNVQGSTHTTPAIQLTEGAAKRGLNILIYGTGWHYVTIKLSDLGVITPANISMVSFSLNSYPTQYTSGDMCIDFVTFTNDAPFVATSSANK